MVEARLRTDRDTRGVAFARAMLYLVAQPPFNGLPCKGLPRVSSLVRFLVFLLVLGALVLGGMFALATFVTPEPREITVDVPSSRLTLD